MNRSSRSDVRNPVLGMLSAHEAWRTIPQEHRAIIGKILRDIAKDADRKAEQSWEKRKGPMAAYWRAVCTYAKHIARAIDRGAA